MIRVPTLFLDPIRCKKNIAKMAAKARRNNVAFRPHVKTHQSLAVARWLKEEGVSKITVSSLKMATYFAQEWNDHQKHLRNVLGYLKSESKINWNSYQIWWL